MKHKLFVSLLLLAPFGLSAQTIQQLFQKGDYVTLTTYYDKADQLSGEELYCVGYAFYTQGNDEGAIEMYDKAIAKGFTADYLYMVKGNSLTYLAEFQEADKCFRIAVKKNPKAQLNYTGLGNNFFYQEKYDSAEVYYHKALEKDFQSSEPYYNLGQLYHIQKKQYNKAIEIYKKGLKHIGERDPLYYKMYSNIGVIEFDKNQNYKAAADAYKHVLKAYPQYYGDYQPYIKACYKLEQYDKGDSLFQALQGFYRNKQLTPELMKQGGIAIAEFKWNNQTIVLYKPFEKPVKSDDLAYKIYLYDKADKNIIRTMIVKKFISKDGKNTPSLCLMEDNGQGGYQYYYTWTSDHIAFKDLEKSVKDILDM